MANGTLIEKINNLIAAIPEGCSYECNLQIAIVNAKLVIAESADDEDELLTAVEELIAAIPGQSNDCDWWPDALNTAVEAAEAVFCA